MLKQLAKDKLMLQHASIEALKSNCRSRQVGAIIAKDDRILSTGYNGTPKGYLNCCEIFPPKSKWDDETAKEHHEWQLTHEIHAEQNAILWAARIGVSIEGATLYTTLQPCNQCTKLAIGAGIKRIVYAKRYPRYSDEQTGEQLAFVHYCGGELCYVGD